MRDGVFTIVLLVSGQGADPANDPNVSIGFYLAKDKLVKDANGGIARDYSFRINPDPRFQSVLPGRTVNGVVQSTQAVELRAHHIETAPFFPQQLLLHKAQVRIEPQKDGAAMAMLGGYRSIADYYKGWAASGAIHELVTHVNMVGYWYALRRNADFLPDAEGQNQAISTAYRMYLVPAYVITPTGDAQVTTARLFDGPIDSSIGGRRLPPPAAPPATPPATPPFLPTRLRRAYRRAGDRTMKRIVCGVAAALAVLLSGPSVNGVKAEASTKARATTRSVQTVATRRITEAQYKRTIADISALTST